MFNISWYQLLQSFWQRNQTFNTCFGGYFKMSFFFQLFSYSFPSTPSFFIFSLWGPFLEPSMPFLPSILPSHLCYNNFPSPNIFLLCSFSPPETRYFPHFPSLIFSRPKTNKYKTLFTMTIMCCHLVWRVKNIWAQLLKKWMSTAILIGNEPINFHQTKE